MQKNNSVVFKGRKEGITVLLDERATFSEIKTALMAKLEDAQKFFGNAKTSVIFKGRELSEDEQDELLSVFKEHSDLNISYASDYASVVAETQPAKRREARAEDIAGNAGNTYYHRGALRSGQSVKFNGSVVVIGDVNPGAEIFAKDNIIVMGLLRGLVHAGCEGNTGSFISAMNLQPMQLRIADIYTVLPVDEDKKAKRKAFPAIAYIEGAKIYIEPLTGAE